MENSKKQIIRYLLLFAGIYIMTLGATLAMSASIGVCPLDTILLALNLILILAITHVRTLREGTVISLAVLGLSINLMRKPVSKIFEMVDRL